MTNDPRRKPSVPAPHTLRSLRTHPSLCLHLPHIGSQPAPLPPRRVSLQQQITINIIFTIRLDSQKSSKSTRSPWRNGSALDFYLTSSGHPKAAGSSPAGDAFLLFLILLPFLPSFYPNPCTPAWWLVWRVDAGGMGVFVFVGLVWIIFFSSVWEIERVLQVTGMRKRKNIAAFVCVCSLRLACSSAKKSFCIELRITAPPCYLSFQSFHSICIPSIEFVHFPHSVLPGRVENPRPAASCLHLLPSSRACVPNIRFSLKERMQRVVSCQAYRSWSCAPQPFPKQKRKKARVIAWLSKQ
jgi:hypothetical protein